jgi:hypothetical protein
VALLFANAVFVWRHFKRAGCRQQVGDTAIASIEISARLRINHIEFIWNRLHSTARWSPAIKTMDNREKFRVPYCISHEL